MCVTEVCVCQFPCVPFLDLTSVIMHLFLSLRERDMAQGH